MFPFREAAVLIRALQQLVEDLDVLHAEHDRQLDGIVPVGRPGFQGARAERFLAEVTDMLEVLRTERAEVDEQIYVLEMAVWQAEQRVDAYERAYAAWTQRALAYDEHQRARRALSPFNGSPPSEAAAPAPAPRPHGPLRDQPVLVGRGGRA